MEITGKVMQFLPERFGYTKTGNPWKAQQFILQTSEAYSRTILFEIFGEDKIRLMNIQVGEDLTVYFDIEAREYQGKWFNKLSVWRVLRPTDTIPVFDQPQDTPLHESKYSDLPFEQDNGLLPFE